MELSTHRRTSALLASALFAIAAVASTPGAAHASRLPADPLTFVGTPVSLDRVVLDAHAANVWAAVLELHSR
jgi:hypothetical protein